VLRDGLLLLVHRERYDDWSFPKGKLERGETWEEAALREVWEETGLRCVLGAFVGTSRYDVAAGEKEVRWWLMSSEDDPRPSNEVDAVRWASIDEARDLLSYDRERVLLDSSVLR
jgi:8-oxo-dGTP diphosphatase